MEAASNPFR